MEDVESQALPTEHHDPPDYDADDDEGEEGLGGSDSEYLSDEDHEVDDEHDVMEPPLKPQNIPEHLNEVDENINTTQTSNPSVKKIRTVKKVFRCSLCDFFSFNRDSTEQHIRIHNEPQNTKLYYCSTCKYSTRIKPYFDKHRKLHSNTIVRPFKCSYCPYQGRFRSHTRAHEMRHHTGEKPFICSLCDRGFVEQHILARHMRTAHTDERPFVCDVCNRSYKQLNALRVHQRKHFDDAYVCEFCQKRFSTIHQLQRHLESHQDKNMHCPLKGCSFKTINKERIDNHVKNFHKKRKCPDCDFESQIHKDFIKHRNSHTKKIIRTPKCPHCSKTFASKHNLQKHMVVHTGNREYQCNKCSYNSQKKSNLVKHLELHRLIESKPELMAKFLKCDDCDFICESKKTLGVHKRIHKTINDEKVASPGDATFTCSLCENILASREQLVDHLLLEHSNYRTNKCHHCKYTTTTQSEMSLHLDFHEIQSNESADVHNCEDCGYMNVDHDMFADHVKKCLTEQKEKKKSKDEKRLCRLHRGDREIKPYKCPLCSSRVQTAASLKNHVLSHSGVHKGRKHLKCNKQINPDDSNMSIEKLREDPNVLFCNECEFWTTNAGALTSHQKVHKMHDNSFVENTTKTEEGVEDAVTDDGYEEDSGADMEGLEESEELTDADDMNETIEMGPDDDEDDVDEETIEMGPDDDEETIEMGPDDVPDEEEDGVEYKYDPEKDGMH